MPLLGNGEYREPFELEKSSDKKDYARRATLPGRRQSQHSVIAKSAIMSQITTPNTDGARTPEDKEVSKDDTALGVKLSDGKLSAPQKAARNGLSNGAALSDTPATTAPNSPVM